MLPNGTPGLLVRNEKGVQLASLVPRPPTTSPPEEHATSFTVSLTTGGGEVYDLGPIAAATRIWGVKKELALLSQHHAAGQQLYLIDDTRDGDEDLELTDQMTLAEVSELAASNTAQIQLVVMVGLKKGLQNAMIDYHPEFSITPVAEGRDTVERAPVAAQQTGSRGWDDDEPCVVIAADLGSTLSGASEDLGAARQGTTWQIGHAGDDSANWYTKRDGTIDTKGGLGK